MPVSPPPFQSPLDPPVLLSYCPTVLLSCSALAAPPFLGGVPSLVMKTARSRNERILGPLVSTCFRSDRHYPL
eukprot:6736230-Pyramimonas_sp.AAC.1